MENFNRKEEVIEFKLTQHGRRLLLSGALRPAYYAFGDPDILYSTNFIGLSGTQNQITEIITGSLRPKLSTFPSTVLDNAKAFKSEFLSPSILGTSDYGNQKFPAFEVKLHKSSFTGTASFNTGTFANQKVPIISAKANCIFNTSTFSWEKHDYILLEINEINGIFEKENFEFEILRKKDVHIYPLSGTYKIEIPLEFLFDRLNDLSEQNFQGDSSAIQSNTELSERVVEYWFNIKTDEEISSVIEFAQQNGNNIYLDPNNNQTLCP